MPTPSFWEVLVNNFSSKCQCQVYSPVRYILKCKLFWFIYDLIRHPSLVTGSRRLIAVLCLKATVHVANRKYRRNAEVGRAIWVLKPPNLWLRVRDSSEPPPFPSLVKFFLKWESTPHCDLGLKATVTPRTENTLEILRRKKLWEFEPRTSI